MDIRILQKENKELDDCFQHCIEDPFDEDDVIAIATREITESNEELRRFYVAVTRTKEHLYLFVPRNAYRYGRQIYRSFAHYLDNGKNFYDTCS